MADDDRNSGTQIGHALALPRELRAAALGAGLSVCAAEEAGAIVEGLIALASEDSSRANWRERVAGWLGADGRIGARDAALAALVGSWERVPVELRGAALAAGAGRWERAVELVVTDADARRRKGVASLAMDACDIGVAACAAALLGDPDEAVSGAAEEAMVSLALRGARAAGRVPEHVLGDLSDIGPTWKPGDMDRLAGIMASAAMVYEQHRRRGAVVAAMVLCGPGGGAGMESLRAWVAGHAGLETGPLKAALRWAKLPIARLRALEWLIHDGLAAVGAERLSRATGVVEHELVLRSWHLGLRPLRRGRLAGVVVMAKDGREAALPGAGAMGMLSAQARRGAVGMAALVKADGAVRRNVVDAALADASGVVRHAAARYAPMGALADWCFDADSRVARSAFLRWSSVGVGGAGCGRGEAEERLAATLGRATDELVRGWAEEERVVRSRGAIGLLRSGAKRRAAACEWEAAMRAALTEGDEERVLAALATVRSMGETAKFAAEVLALAGRGGQSRLGDRIAATAMAMTAGVSGADAAAARAVQVRGLRSEDRRTRANAVEAMAAAKSERGSPSVVHALMELKSDPDHRVRANVLRAALREPMLAGRARSEMLAMLEDARDMHRLAAVWLAGRTPRLSEGEEVAARIGVLACGDASEHVRARARAVEMRMRPAAQHGRLRLVRAEEEAEGVREVA